MKPAGRVQVATRAKRIATRGIGGVVQKASASLRLACWKLLRPEIPVGEGVAIVKSDSDWEIANEVFIRGEYDQAIQLALAEHPGEGAVRIVDLGANVGFFSLRTIQLYSQRRMNSALELLAIEGSPSLFGDLETRLSSRDDQVTLRLKSGLVGRRTGHASVYSSMFMSSNNAVVRDGGKISRNPFRNSYAERAAYVDLDEMLAPEITVDLIKCDIEGSERDFLENYPALLKRTRLLIIELHGDHSGITTCREVIRTLGFIHMRTVKKRPTHSLELYQRG